MDRTEKERVVEELTERLRSAESLIVADYRGLTNAQIAELRGELIGLGARFVVVKNTLTRRAAEAAGADGLLALLEGPTAIAFVEADGDSAAVAKALAKSSRDTKVLTLRGAVLAGEQMSGEDVERLATLPPLDALRGQVLGVVVAPLTGLAALLAAPLQNLVGLIDARVEQLGGADGSEDGAVAEATPVDESGNEAAPDEKPVAVEEASSEDDDDATTEDDEDNDDQPEAPLAASANEEE